MAFHIHAALAALCVAFVACQAALPEEIYWNSVLPNTPMPRSISDALQPGKVEDRVPELHQKKIPLFGYSPESDQVPELNQKNNPFFIYSPSSDQVPELHQKKLPFIVYSPESDQKNNPLIYSPGSDQVSELHQKNNPHFIYSPDSDQVPELHQKKLPFIVYSPESDQKNNPLIYSPDSDQVPELHQKKLPLIFYSPESDQKNNPLIYSPGSDQIPELHQKNFPVPELVNPPSIHFFLEKDLAPGKQMEMEFTRPESVGYAFIPRGVADSIPFSSDKLPQILTQLSIEPKSPKAQMVKDTLKKCEIPAGEGEVRTCATSLEAMIDFSVQRLGKNIQAFSTEPEKYANFQKFTILPDIKRIGDDKAVSCHQLNYAYAVFFCHDVKGARAYSVPFIGTSGTQVNAVAVCHTNTTTWNPEHMAFKILKLKPGGEPVCHFLPEHDVLWTARPHVSMPVSGS